MAGTEPSFQRHLAPVSGSSDLVVSWVPPAGPAVHPLVRYGPAGSSLPQHATPLRQAAHGDGHVSYHARLAGLAPHTVYQYAVGDNATGVFSAPAEFVTAAVGAAAGFTMAVVGDMGVRPYGNATAARLAQHAASFNFTLHVGDFAYADDRAKGRDPKVFNGHWDDFMAMIEPVSASKPYG